MKLELGTILQKLQDSEINAGCQSFYDSNWSAWIGDPEWNGIRLKCDGGLQDQHDVARWLHIQAIIHFPDSDYAKENA